MSDKSSAKSKSRIDVAVFPVAGRGTRFLPATKASPKEMLPIVDKPLIQYAVEEALQAGARRLVFITGASKRAIEDHFDTDGELEGLLVKQGKSDLLKTLRSVLPSYASCIYIRQPAPLGLGHAVLCAKPAVGNAPFFVHLADDLIDAPVACLKQMAQRFVDGSIVGVQTVPKDQTDKYGIVKTAEKRGDLLRIDRIVEKPKPAQAPSNLAVVGRYLLTPRLFLHLEKIGEGAGGEIQLPTASRDSWVTSLRTPTSSTANDMTAAASSATCRPTWNTPSRIRNSRNVSAATCVRWSRN